MGTIKNIYGENAVHFVMKLCLILTLKKTKSSMEIWASLMAQTGKNLPAMRETWVRSLGWEDPPGSGRSLGEGKGYPLCNILAWRIPWAEEPGGLQSMWLQRTGHD